MKNRNLDHSDNWATPKEFLKKNGFDKFFDPCPLNHNIEEWDGLTIDWKKKNFVNPPYSQKLKEKFIHKAIHELGLGRSTVMLLPVSTDTKIFHDYILEFNTYIKFVKGRLPFMGINTKGQKVNFHLIGEWSDKTIYNTKGEKIPLYVKNSGMHGSMLVFFEAKNNYINK